MGPAKPAACWRRLAGWAEAGKLRQGTGPGLWEMGGTMANSRAPRKSRQASSLQQQQVQSRLRLQDWGATDAAALARYGRVAARWKVTRWQRNWLASLPTTACRLRRLARRSGHGRGPPGLHLQRRSGWVVGNGRRGLTHSTVTPQPAPATLGQGGVPRRLPAISRAGVAAEDQGLGSTGLLQGPGLFCQQQVHSGNRAGWGRYF